MKLTPEQVSEFKELVEKEFKVPVSQKEAEESARNFISVLAFVFRE